MPATAYCHADLQYVDTADPSGYATRPVRMSIADGRSADLPGWASNGFELLNAPSSVAWDDDAELEARHYDEIAALAKALTGARHAVVNGHIRRNPEQAALHPDLGAIQYVHSDFAASYGERLQRFYADGEQQADAALARAGIGPEVVARAERVMVMNFWRNVGPERMDLPLAVADCRHAETARVQAYPVVDYAGDGFDFETLGALPPESEEAGWYTFPNMARNEVLAFRTYDSDRVGTTEPFWTLHTAFADPTAQGALPRTSIELRATCLF